MYSVVDLTHINKNKNTTKPKKDKLNCSFLFLQYIFSKNLNFCHIYIKKKKLKKTRLFIAFIVVLFQISNKKN